MPPVLRRHMRWIAPVAVLALAALLRFWALGRPSTLVFDELFYVRDAISQLTHGFPTVWPDSDPDMSGSRATAFTDRASNAVHPPLGKWLIGVGVLIFGTGSGWGWRFAVAFAGVATVAVTMRLGWLMTRSLVTACLAGLLLAIDGVHITLSRVALLDGFLTFFIALGALFVWKDLAARLPGDAAPPAVWRRPWLFAAGLAFGAAAAVKWSGLYPLAFFLVFAAVWDLIASVRAKDSRPVWRSALRAAASGIVAIPAAAIVYLASWSGWILTSGGHARDAAKSWFASLAHYHVEMFRWHSTLNAEHPFAANPLTWPLALRPTGMYKEQWGDEGAGQFVAGISALPNPLVTWAGVAALIALAVLTFARHRDPIAPVAAFVVTGYLSGWLPWVLTVSRSAVFQFYAVVLTPFSALALAIGIAMLANARIHTPLGTATPLPFDTASTAERRSALAVFLVAAAVIALLFWPVWSATPVAEWFWQSHMWLPGWR